MEPTKVEEVLVFFEANTLTVWAGAGQLELLRSIEGVHNAFDDGDNGTRYTVFIDRRYERESVAETIKSALAG